MKTRITAIVALGLVAVLAIPVVAVALMRSGDGVSSSQAAATAIDEAVPTQQRLRVHAETGPPEGVEPIRRQLHRVDGQGQGQANGDTYGRGQANGGGFGQGRGASGGLGYVRNG